MDGGFYIAVFWLAKGRRIRVGRLGMLEFAAGYYFYVGSAKRNLAVRLARHARRRKKLHWHIDYLARHAEMLGAIVLADRRRSECRIAGELAEIFDRAAAGFGDSDCRRGGHLFHGRSIVP